MPEVQPIALSESNWSEIADALGIAGDDLQIKPFEPVSDGFFTAAIAAVPGEWQRLAIAVFPYEDVSWQRLASTVLEFEARSWERWRTLQERLTANSDGACAPMWWSREQSLRPAVRNVSITLDDGRTVQIPSLVRPYIPYPTLRDSPLAPARVTAAIGDLQRIAEWIVSEEEITAFLQRRASPSAPLRAARRWWQRLLWWRHGSPGPFVIPRLADAAADDAMTADQLMTDGRQLIPTRWRAFHREHSHFGKTP